MDNCNSRTDFFVALLRSADRSLLIPLMLVCWRILASLRVFFRRDLTPRSFQELELRLERLGRELARVLLQFALNKIEASSLPHPIQWERHDTNGVRKVLTRAAQQKRRQGLAGSEKDYNSAKNYLSRYRAHMDYAKRPSEGDPIGSGVTAPQQNDVEIQPYSLQRTPGKTKTSP